MTEPLIDATEARHMTKLLTQKEVSEITGIPEKTLERWRCEKVKLPYIKTGFRVRYDSADVERWLQDNRQTPSVQRLVESKRVRL